MKVCHVVYNYWGYSGATEQAKKITKEMSVSNKFVFLNNTSKNKLLFFKQDYEFNNKVYTLPSMFFFKMLSLMVIYIFEKFDVVHFHGFHRLPILVSTLFKKQKKLFKCTLLGVDDLNSLLLRKDSLLVGYLLKHITIINCLNTVIYDINRRVVPESKLTIIPNGVDVDEYDGGTKDKIVVIVGAVIPRKNVLHAIKFYNEHFYLKGYKLIIIGPHDHSVGEYSEDYFNKCLTESRVKSNEAVEFIGHVNNNELKRYYRKASCNLFFSKREGTPNVVLESMSHNCPVIFNASDKVVSSIMGCELTKLLSVKNGSGFDINNIYEVSNTTKLILRARNFDTKKIANDHLSLYASM